jgi:threonine/homoserine/homoserine lactone efflux protein
MLIATWLAFVAASLVLLFIPGPTVTLVVGYAIARGRASAIATALGVALGDFTAMSLSLLGLGAILAASASLFTAVKLIGGAYLVYLGWKLWTAPVQVDGDLAINTQGTSHRGMFWHAFVVTALNPKSILFFVAFVPQFIDKQSAYGPQVAILVATFVVLAVVNSLAYALVAARARTMLRIPSVLKAVNRTGGGILMGAGVAAALTRAQ